MIAVSGAFAALECGPDEPPPEPPDLVFDPAALDGMVEVAACRHSHEHDLRHVRILADPGSAEIYERCVIPDTACTEPFPVGSLFVKLEYDHEGCIEDDIVSYTATLKVGAGQIAHGGDWRWQRVSADGTLEADWAPHVCVRCHVDHCSEPDGFDLRCVVD